MRAELARLVEQLLEGTAEGDTVRFQELIKGATESISAGLSLSIEILDQD